MTVAERINNSQWDLGVGKVKTQQTTKQSITLFACFMLLMCALWLGKIAHAESAYTEIEWTQLMPADDLEALLNPPDFLADIEDGASNDNLDTLSALSETDETAKRFEQALNSSRVIEAFDQARIRLPGFIVPLESDEQQRVTEFFIVPYFGACLHLPPPPPNQIIYSENKDGIVLESLQEPFWFEGTLIIDSTDNALGSSAYTLRLDKSYPYEG
ncbi:DUF3299 domain-containing protein [Ningiella sp. W23]|uniref:DUF3299 domain-containing protein n=1 Tax=Ningiella sp. W23 TaxID=3023715 RepID=UPI0037564AD7